jgi:AraC-like DNA-binding protein
MFYRNSKSAFRILGVFYLERGKKSSFPNAGKRWHSALSYRVVGESTFCSGGKTLHAQSNSIVYLPRGIDFQITSGEEKLIVLHLENFGEEETEIQILSHTEKMEPLFRNLLSTWEQNRPDSYARTMEGLYALFAALQQSENPQMSRVPEKIAPGVNLLREQFRNPALTVSALANTCFVSEVYFRRVYKECFGESPMQTLQSLRFDYACELLRSGYYSPKQVAQLAGFSDVKYFRAAFTRRFGCSPSEYVRTHDPVRSIV